jgi:hypothetical protein
LELIRVTGMAVARLNAVSLVQLVSLMAGARPVCCAEFAPLGESGGAMDLEPSRFDFDAALVEQVLDVPQRQQKADVERHRHANDVGARL